MLAGRQLEAQPRVWVQGGLSLSPGSQRVVGPGTSVLFFMVSPAVWLRLPHTLVSGAQQPQ